MRKLFFSALSLVVLSGPVLAQSYESLQKQGDKQLAAKKYGKAISTLEKLVYLYPGRPDGYNALGFAYFLDGRYDRAILVFKQALTYDPKNSLAQKNLIVAVGKKALEQTRALEFQEALSLLRSTETLFADNPQALILRYSIGQLEFYRNKEDQGFAAWKTVAEKLPDSGTAKFVRAHELQDAGKTQEALASYQAAIDKVPEEAIFRNYYGLCLFEAGKLDAAQAQFQKALAKDPPYLDLYLSAAQVYQRQGNLDQAVDAVKKGRNLRPDYASTHLWLASLYRAQGKAPASSRELGLAFGADKRPAVLVDSTPAGAVTWVDNERVGATPFGVFVSAGKHRLKVQQPGKPPLIKEIQIVASQVCFAKAGDDIQTEFSETSTVVPTQLPAPSFALRDHANHYWRSFQHFHTRPVVLLFFGQGSPETAESLATLSNLASQYQDKIGCAIIYTGSKKKSQALSQMMTLPANFGRLFDDGSVATRYGIKAEQMPAVVVVDLDGYIAYTGTGLQGVNGAKAVLDQVLTATP